MSQGFNYRHLHYFWVVAKEGGIAKGAARLGVAVQTVSAQVRELERALGQALLRPAGRTLALTEAGAAALKQADLIFQLGEQLPALVRDAARAPGVRLRIGLADNLPKLVIHSLMAPVLGAPRLKLQCHVDEFADLLAELALHRFDVVLADRPAPGNPNLKLFSHALSVSPMAWYAAPTLVAAARKGFPQSLAKVPVLLPTAHAAVRHRLDHWFERHGIVPQVVGEFEDSALLKTFGAGGMGVFAASERVHDELTARYAVSRVGGCDGVEEHCYAIATERRVAHPLVQRLLAESR